MEARWIFGALKLHRKKYVETTSIFRPSKLHWKQHVETTWIFRSAKLHWKCTWKWRGNSSKFSLRRIHVISTLNRRRFDVECSLGRLGGLRWLSWYILLYIFFVTHANFIKFCDFPKNYLGLIIWNWFLKIRSDFCSVSTFVVYLLLEKWVYAWQY